jgi:hypothetical protein
MPCISAERRKSVVTPPTVSRYTTVSDYKTIENGLDWDEVEKIVRMFGDAKRKNIRVQLSATYGVPFAEGETHADEPTLSGEEEHPTSSSTTPGRRLGVTIPATSTPQPTPSPAASSANRPQASQTVRKRRTAIEIEKDKARRGYQSR